MSYCFLSCQCQSLMSCLSRHAMMLYLLCYVISYHAGPKNKNKDMVLTCKGRSLAVSCDTQEDRNIWVRVINDAIQQEKRGNKEIHLQNFDGSQTKVAGGSKVAGLMGV